MGKPTFDLYYSKRFGFLAHSLEADAMSKDVPLE
jgi:hypothetical protein